MAQRLTVGLARAFVRQPLRRALSSEAPKAEPFAWADTFKSALVFGGTFTCLTTLPWAVGYLMETQRQLQRSEKPVEQHVYWHEHARPEAPLDPEAIAYINCIKLKPKELSTCQAEWTALLQRVPGDTVH